MKLVYKPKGGEKQSWPADLEEIDLDLAEIGDLEKTAGMSLMAFRQQMVLGHFGILRPLLYVLLKRTDPSLKYGDFRPKLAEIDYEQERPELEALKARVLADPEFPDRDETLAQVERQLAELPEPEPGPGKGRGSASGGTSRPTARSPRSGKSTRSRSK